MKWEGGQVSPCPNPRPLLCSIHLGEAQLQDAGEMESAQRLQSNIPRPRNVRFGSKADINAVLIDVCFTPQERTLPERVGMSALCQKMG